MDELKGSLPYGATPIEDYSDLKLDYISSKKELFDAEFINISTALAKYLSKRNPLTKLTDVKFLQKIHFDMFNEVWAWAGKKRKTNKTVGVDKFLIDVCFKNLIDDMKYWEEQKTDTLENSAMLHHRLVFIHPFENGNGRWSRLVTNMYLQTQINKIISWPEKDLYGKVSFRKRYIQALRDADKGAYSELINLHEENLT